MHQTPGFGRELRNLILNTKFVHLEKAVLVARTLFVVAGHTEKTVPAIETSANALGGI